MILIWFGLSLLVGVSIINGVCYVWCTPTPFTQRVWVGRARWWLRFATFIHTLAYGLTLGRLPFALLPYLVKLSLGLVMGTRFVSWWQWMPIQVLRWLGDIANGGLTAMGLLVSTLTAPTWVQALVHFAISAELARLILEKGQMLVSVLWQSFPHRQLAIWLQASPMRRWGRAYIYYYRRSDQRRFNYMLRLLRWWSATNSVTAAKLRYVSAFRTVPSKQDLRAGEVRDVVRGEIFVHARWSNDPWLLIGLALRRSPWIFDPRYLHRPFFYRTEANPRATRFVLGHAHFSPPFALYQFGHEIKVARFEVFYRLGRMVNIHLEEPVQADGTYRFDPLMTWLKKRLHRGDSLPTRPLWTTTDVLATLRYNPPATLPSVQDLATHYTYPYIYVDEVLFPEVCQALSSTADTVSGASQ